MNLFQENLINSHLTQQYIIKELKDLYLRISRITKKNFPNFSPPGIEYNDKERN